MAGEEDFTLADAKWLFGSRPFGTSPKQNFVWNWPLGAGAIIQLRLRVADRVDVVEVTELPCRPRLLAGRGQQPVQFWGQLVACRVLVVEQRVSALTGLGKDFGERRLPVASVQAVEGGLLPARLYFGLARLGQEVRTEVLILRRRKGVFALEGSANVVPGTILRRNIPKKLPFNYSRDSIMIRAKLLKMEKDQHFFTLRYQRVYTRTRLALARM